MDLREATTTPVLRHPWEQSRAEFIARVLSHHGLTRQPLRVLDVGSGDAWLADTLTGGLAPGSRTTCWDTNYTPEQIGRLSGSLASGAIELTRDEPAGSFDLALLLDVTEHVPDDRAFLADIAGRVKPGGHVMFTVPAWQSLFSEHDRLLGHYRRYAPAEARERLVASGLEVVAAGGLFHSLLPVRAVGTLRERLAPAPASSENLGTWKGSEQVTRAVLGALRVDNALSWQAAERGVELPGLSWWALCRKSQ